MCAGCTSTGATLVVQGSVVVGLAQGSLRRLRRRYAGADAHTRRCAAYRANSEFLAGLGLDPERVLGLPPAEPSDVS
jgi:hypothetical protein